MSSSITETRLRDDLLRTVERIGLDRFYVLLLASQARDCQGLDPAAAVAWAIQEVGRQLQAYA